MRNQTPEPVTTIAETPSLDALERMQARALGQPSQALPGPQAGARRMLQRDEIAAAVDLGQWHGA
jgi:hypothetical protein